MMTKNLEKIVFLKMTCLQLGRIDADNPEFMKTFSVLSNEERDDFVKLNEEIHNVWSAINCAPFITSALGRKSVDSVCEYDRLVQNVDPRILKISTDFGITLRESESEEYKNYLKKRFGEDYGSWFKE